MHWNILQEITSQVTNQVLLNLRQSKLYQTLFPEHGTMRSDINYRLSWWLRWWRIHLECRIPQFDSWVRKIPWRRDRLPPPVFFGFPCGSANKESACNVGNLGSILGLGKFPGEGKGYPLQYSGLENSMDYAVHGVTKSRTRLSPFHFQYSCPDNSIDRGVLWATGHGVTENHTWLSN